LSILQSSILCNLSIPQSFSLAGVQRELAAQQAIAADIAALEERYWHDLNEYQLSLQQHISERDGLLQRIDRAGQQLLLLKSTNVLNDTFRLVPCNSKHGACRSLYKWCYDRRRQRLQATPSQGTQLIPSQAAWVLPTEYHLLRRPGMSIKTARALDPLHKQHASSIVDLMLHLLGFGMMVCLDQTPTLR
jgi:hypothetical protein